LLTCNLRRFRSTCALFNLRRTLLPPLPLPPLPLPLQLVAVVPWSVVLLLLLLRLVVMVPALPLRQRRQVVRRQGVLAPPRVVAQVLQPLAGVPRSVVPRQPQQPHSGRYGLCAGARQARTQCWATSTRKPCIAKITQSCSATSLALAAAGLTSTCLLPTPPRHRTRAVCRPHICPS
jgi:hypothetical protein